MNDRLNVGDTLLERRRVRHAFDRAAERYDSAAGLQRRAAERLLAHVQARDADPTAILDAGCGTGYGARLLSGQYPHAALYALDIAPGMLRQTRRECPTVRALICADAERLPLRAEAVDLLWSSAMLQWCNDLPAVFAGFHATLARGGLLAFATFGPATLQELRYAFDDGYTHVSRFADADTLHARLAAAGFSEVRMEARRTVLRYPEVNDLLRSIRTIGAGNATAGRARGLTGKLRWAAMRTRYEALREERGLPATYELIYATARKD